MSERTGLGAVETDILLTLDRVGARADRPHRKSANLLAELDGDIGLGPRYGYDMLCDLVRPWVLAIPLIDGHGNFGSPDDGAAEPRYTECRLSAAGALAVAAERETVPALPIDLINGSVYRGGLRPPFAPARLLDALLALVADATTSDDRVVAIVGPPAFASGCEVSGEIEELVAGRRASLRCSARCTRTGSNDRDGLELAGFPPGWGPDRIMQSIATRVERPPEQAQLALGDVRLESNARTDRIVCDIEPGADVDDVERRLLAVWGVSVDIAADLGAPLPDVLRAWVDRHATDGTADALQSLRTLTTPG